MRIKNSIEVFDNGPKDKTPIIFIHGFPYDHTMWDNQVEFLKNDYRCITYDIRGLGKSAVGDGQYTMEMFVDDLFDIIDELQLVKPVICGLSMGGYISFRAVEREQDKFGGVIFCDTKAFADNTVNKLKRANAIKMVNNDGLEAYVKDIVPKTFAEQTLKNNYGLFEKILNVSKNSNPVGVKGCILAMTSRTDTTEYLAKIEIPVLIIGGISDALTPPEVLKEIAEKIKGSELIIIPEAGHMAPVENPEIVSKSIQKFLKKLKI